MRLDAGLTDDAVLAEVGARLARARLDRNVSQEQLAHEAGVSRDTVRRIEAGKNVAMTGFVRVLRALNLLAGLEALIPPPAPSPIELRELEGRRRRRASPPRDAPPRPWRWGDER